jgi:hypothetical protein
MNAKSGSICPKTNVCQDYRWRSCLLHNRFSVLFPCISTQPSTPRLTEVRIIMKFLVSLETPNTHSITRCCTTSKPLIGHEYSKVLTVSTARPQVNWKQEVARSVRPIHWLPRVWFMCWQCKENEVVSHHAWNTCLVFDEQAVFQEYWYIIRKPMVYCTCWSVRQINWPICLHSALQGYPSIQSNIIFHV